jgi:hypothetical protein
LRVVRGGGPSGSRRSRRADGRNDPADAVMKLLR